MLRIFAWGTPVVGNEQKSVRCFLGRLLIPIAKQLVKIKVKVVPGASSRVVVGWLEVPAKSIKLVSGSRSIHKTFELSDISQARVDAKFGDII
jgi:uncharacterized protein YggU (UPF0235/DUF167 family)